MIIMSKIMLKHISHHHYHESHHHHHYHEDLFPLLQLLCHILRKHLVKELVSLSLLIYDVIIILINLYLYLQLCVIVIVIVIIISLSLLICDMIIVLINLCQSLSLLLSSSEIRFSLVIIIFIEKKTMVFILMIKDFTSDLSSNW